MAGRFCLAFHSIISQDSFPRFSRFWEQIEIRRVLLAKKTTIKADYSIYTCRWVGLSVNSQLLKKKKIEIIWDYFEGRFIFTRPHLEENPTRGEVYN